jgi:hypothetical protein
MLRGRFGTLPVVDRHGKVVGMITDLDRPAPWATLLPQLEVANRSCRAPYRGAGGASWPRDRAHSGGVHRPPNLCSQPTDD